nr:polyprenyl diphosphate synthase [Ostreibacterium oceani]
MPLQHIAIIMDGNGRFAESIGRSRLYGHRAGHTAVLRTVRHCAKMGLRSLTLYAFSSENWQRPESEIQALMQLFLRAIKRNRRLFNRHGIRFRVIGDTSAFPRPLHDAIDELTQETQTNQGLQLNIAANYGGKWDITQAVKQLATQVENQTLSPQTITEKDIATHLELADQAPVDLLIRTGGEQRISNFLLWQCAYAELYFTPIYWPVFDDAALDDAIADFTHRTRRFGGL